MGLSIRNSIANPKIRSFLMSSIMNRIFCQYTVHADDKPNGYCYDSTTPVLGGVDMVQFFTTFKISDGIYNESEVGQLGSSRYSSTYGNYTYHFVSRKNLRWEPNETLDPCIHEHWSLYFPLLFQILVKLSFPFHSFLSEFQFILLSVTSLFYWTLFFTFYLLITLFYNSDCLRLINLLTFRR